MEGMIFAFGAAFTFALLAIFSQQAAKNINNVFGAIMISAVAVVLGLFFLFPILKSKTALWTDPKALILITLGGICAFSIDYFTLKAYNSGLPVSTGAPIIFAGSIAIAATIGFVFLHEAITPQKIAGIIMVILGIVVLTKYMG